MPEDRKMFRVPHLPELCIFSTTNKKISQRTEVVPCGYWKTIRYSEVYSGAEGETIVQTYEVSYYIFCSTMLEGGGSGGGSTNWDPSNVGLGGYLFGGGGSSGVYYYTGSGGVGSATYGWWNYGYGYNGIYIDGYWYDPNNLYPSWNTPAQVWLPTQEEWMLEQLSIQIRLLVGKQFWLMEHLSLVPAIFNYLNDPYSSLSYTEREEIVNDHITALTENSDYRNFVENYTANNPDGGVWWENEVFVENNISTDLNGCFPSPCDLKILNAEEKEFCKKYPVAMFFIAHNRQLALTATNQEYGLPPNNTLIHPNDKSNAFIHALFCALNANNMFIGPQKASLFADAHESNTPAQFNIEKIMDDHNNDVGINISISNSLINIVAAIRDAIIQGYLLYLSPLNLNDGCFWGCPSNTLGTHGIDNNTQLKPTNQ